MSSGDDEKSKTAVKALEISRDVIFAFFDPFLRSAGGIL